MRGCSLAKRAISQLAERSIDHVTARPDAASVSQRNFDALLRLY
jgi:hypothetical protein